MTAGRAARAARQVGRWFGRGRLAALVLLALLALAKLTQPALLRGLEMRGFDLLSQIFPREAPAESPVAIVDIDDDSLAMLGQWPWPRTLIADLVDRLGQAGVAAVGFDVLFAEPDRLSPALIADRLPQLDAAARSELKQSPSNEQVLAQALGRTRAVLGLAAVARPAASAPSMPPTPVAALGEDPLVRAMSLAGLLSPLPELAAAAQGGGLMTLLPELDGVVRRVPLVLNVAGRLYPALSVEMLRVGQGESTYVVRSNPYGIEQLVVGQFVVPTDSLGRVWVRYAPRRTPIYIPAKAVLDGSVQPEALAGRLVLIGTSAIGLQDVKATPLDAALPGVEVHAQLIETVLAQSFLSRPDYLPAIEFWLLLALGTALVVIVPIAGAQRSAGLAVAIAVALAGSAAWLFARQSFLLDVTLPLLATVSLYGVLAYSGFRGEEAARRQIRGAFNLYLPPEYVEQLANDPSKLALGGELRELTVLFCDIRGFTTISEQFREDPAGLTRLINRFMTPMSAAIHERGGTIDKYIGDCVMAFWNAPLPAADHASRSCFAAMDMVRRLKVLNATLRAEQGEEHAEYQQAKALVEGEGAARDPSRAAALFRAEAERGYANAQYNLAKAHRDGMGVAQDQREATRWFRAAAEQGHARSQERLGARLTDGIGTVRDAIEGAAWLSLAAGQGLGSAAVALERVLAELDAPARNEVQRRARAIRPKLARLGAFELQCGVGLNTGTCIVGNMGSDQRFNYSALGDTVNLASRLEGLTKSYGVDIVAGESTRNAAPDFAWLELDLIAVKGRSEATRVFALLGDAEVARSAAFVARTAAHMRMLAAYRSQSWIEARALLQDCRAGGLQDLYDLYAARIDSFEQTPPGPDWRGVALAESK